MTYSVLDENSHIVGGGISPGVKVRLQSLADYTGSLPIIDHKKFKSLVEGAIAAKTPLPFFAKDTEMAMVSATTAANVKIRCKKRKFIPNCTVPTTNLESKSAHHIVLPVFKKKRFHPYAENWRVNYETLSNNSLLDANHPLQRRPLHRKGRRQRRYHQNQRNSP